ncbi:MAG: tetraacyldisaccharide 4'-kinase [Thermodesulfobacteriota bacterium]|nr:tetraacyldisaccharide 4'-kinase [Thermodesulfobacteriota bacterium]
MNPKLATRNLLVTMLNYLLSPLGYLYGQVMRLRSRFYEFGLFKTRSLACRVISIGNLTLGGTGKTPLTIWLARYLKGKGQKVAIVSRGYRAKNKRPVSIVSDGQRILLGPDEAGDEPFMMARNLPGVPLLTGKERFLVGMRAIEDFSPDVVLLDDGYQHLGLDRDLNLLLLRTVKPFGKGRVFPAGTLREPLSALKRADAFILTYAEEEAGSVMEEQRLFLQERFPNKPVFVSYCKPISFYLLNETHMSYSDTKDNENNPPSPPFTKGGHPLSPPLKKDGNSSIPPLGKDGNHPSIPPLKKGGDQLIPPLEKGDTGGFSDEKASHNLSELKGKKALAFCGIAHPDSFRKTLIHLGVDLVDFMAYRDHYDYHRSDIEEIEGNAARKSADCIITTEKDAVKIEKPIELNIPVGVLKTEFIFESDFVSFIDECMGI